MVIKAKLNWHPERLDPVEYHICAVEMLPIDEFKRIQAAPMANHPAIARYKDKVGIDLRNSNAYALLLINDANMDGILVDGNGYAHCDFAAYLPGIRGAVEYQIMGMAKELVYDTLETTQNPDCTVPWEKLNKQLGFAVTQQSGLWEVIGETLEENMDVRGWNLTAAGIELNLEPMACAIMQDESQDISMS